MANVLILGASGKIARLVTQQLLKETQHHLSLFCRNIKSLNTQQDNHVHLFEGNVLDTGVLQKAMIDTDIVYANLSGSDLGLQATSVVKAMQNQGIKRLIFITSMGIYNEVSDASQNLENNPALKPYRALADVVEASELDYTLIRPGWFTNSTKERYEVSQKGEIFRGSQISKLSLVQFIAQIINHPELYIKESIGIYDR